MKQLLLSAIVCSILSAFPLEVLAQASPDGAPPMFELAVEALREGRYADAAEGFGRMAELSPQPATLCNLAVTYDRWGGHEREAAEAYERCAAADQTGRYAAHATQRAAEIRAAIAAATPVTPADPRNPFGDPVNVPDNSVPVTENNVPIQDTTNQTPRTPGRGHALLGVGIAFVAASGGLLAGGVVMSNKSSDDRDWLDERFPGDDPVLLEQGSEEAKRLNQAERRRNTAIGLYVGAGALAATGIILSIVDLVGGGLESGVYVAPARAGATVGVVRSF